MHQCAHMSRKHAHTRFIATALVYNECVLICARIFMKILLVVNYYLVSLSFKFHEHPYKDAGALVVNGVLAMKGAHAHL